MDGVLAGSGDPRRGGLGGRAGFDVFLDGFQLLDGQMAAPPEYLPATGRS